MVSSPPLSIASLIPSQRWDEMQSACEMDLVSTACLLARWHRLTDARLAAGAIEDRILRSVIPPREGHDYVAVLAGHRQRGVAGAFAKAANDAAVLAPWLEQDAA